MGWYIYFKMVLRAIALSSQSFEPTESRLRKTSHQQAEQKLVRLTRSEATLRSRAGTALPWQWACLEKRAGKCMAIWRREKTKAPSAKPGREHRLCTNTGPRGSASGELAVTFITYTQCRLGSITFGARMLKFWQFIFFEDLCDRQRFKQLTWVSHLIPKRS